MKAVQVREFGDESVLLYEDVPEPEIGPDEILISVRSAALNRGDLGRRSGAFRGPAAAPLPLIIGWDVAGDVLSLGANVTGFSPGQRVVSLLPSGGYAEQAAAPATLRRQFRMALVTTRRRACRLSISAPGLPFLIQVN